MAALSLPLSLRLGIILIFLSGCAELGVQDTRAKFADAHIHYNWDHAEIISARAVAEKLRSEGVGLTIISSTPSHLALDLQKVAGDWVVPFFSPYIHELGKRDWYLDEKVVKLAEAGLRNRQYFGIGEIHFMAGFLPRPKNAIFVELMSLARQYQVPALIHVDSANEKYFLDICTRHSQVNIIFAHAGGNLGPHHIKKVLERCGNVWIDFAAKDEWRYGGLVNNENVLQADWKKLVLAYPDRFITGTDPVWRVTRTQSWDQSDDGWDHYNALFLFHQHWLSDLPEAVRRKIAWENVRAVLRLTE